VTNDPNSANEIASSDEVAGLAIPLWIAVSVSVLLAMPLSLWLGEFNFTLWCAFIVWAQYFALGANLGALGKIVIPYTAGVVATSLTLAALPLLSFVPDLVVSGDLSSTIGIVSGIAIMIIIMERSALLQAGSLPYFNGISMALAIYFTGSFPMLFSSLPDVFNAGAWTVLMGLFGCLLGVFNVWLMNPSNPFSRMR